MEQAGSLEGWALETPDGLEAFEHMSFDEAYGKFWQVPVVFTASVGHDKRLSPSIRTGVIYNLAVITGATEVLLRVYQDGLADGIFDRPENVKEYAKIMLRLKAIYEDYKSREKVKGVDLVRAVRDIVEELFAFVWEVMSQTKVQR